MNTLTHRDTRRNLAGVDDLISNVQFILRDDGSPKALKLERRVTRRYRDLHTALVTILQNPWRTGALAPATGEEPFNLTEAERALEWALAESAKTSTKEKPNAA